MKRILLSPWTALITLFLVATIRIQDPTFVESVRLRYFDTLITNQPDKPLDIYAIDIDEPALDRYGQ